MKLNFNDIKAKAKTILDKWLVKVTLSQARITIWVVTAIVMILFVATPGGRDIMKFVGYVGCLGAILACAYRLYKYAEKAKGDPTSSTDGSLGNRINSFLRRDVEIDPGEGEESTPPPVGTKRRGRKKDDPE